MPHVALMGSHYTPNKHGPRFGGGRHSKICWAAHTVPILGAFARAGVPGASVGPGFVGCWCAICPYALEYGMGHGPQWFFVVLCTLGLCGGTMFVGGMLAAH